MCKPIYIFRNNFNPIRVLSRGQTWIFYRKALKALFTLRAEYVSLGQRISSSLHIFDHTIKAILLYGAEIWGCYLPPSFKLEHLCDWTKQSTFSPSSKMDLHFVKSILGVHRNSSNYGVMSEVGIMPIILDCFEATIGYWHRLENISSDLLKKLIWTRKNHMRREVNRGFLLFLICLMFWKLQEVTNTNHVLSPLLGILWKQS